MASKSIKGPLIRQILVRSYAQAPSVAQPKDLNLESSSSKNTFIAAVDNGSPLTRVTIAFKAGARYEPASELGISHVLRSAAGLTTKHASSFMINRNLQQIGANVTATGDREFLYYTLEATQNNLQTAVDYLTYLISEQEFRPWELSDNLPRLKFDILSLPPQVRAVDLLHKAAFRRGLGNSLFISPKRIGQISSESLLHYADNCLTASQCAVVVVGDNMSTATSIANKLKLGKGSKAVEPTSYCGGELRKEMGSELAHVVLALQGAPTGSPQALALAVAAKALGNGPVTKWGADHSPLSKSIGNIGPFAAAGFNVTYSDAGLFGVILSVPKDEACAAVKSVACLLKNPNLDTDDITAGKNQLKLQVLSEQEDGTRLAESIAAQGLSMGGVCTAADIVRQIDNLSPSDVLQACAKAYSTKISMSAVGSIFNVPYADELN